MANPPDQTSMGSNDATKAPKITKAETAPVITESVVPSKTEFKTQSTDQSDKKQDDEPLEIYAKTPLEDDGEDKDKKKRYEEHQAHPSKLQQLLESFFGQGQNDKDEFQGVVSDRGMDYVEMGAQLALERLKDQENYTDEDLQALKEEWKKDAGEFWNKHAEGFADQVIERLQSKRQQHLDRHSQTETTLTADHPEVNQTKATSIQSNHSAPEQTTQSATNVDSKPISRAELWPPNEPPKNIIPLSQASNQSSKDMDRRLSVDNLMENINFKTTYESAGMHKIDAEKVAKIAYDALKNKNPDAVSDKTHLEAATKLVDKASQFNSANDPNMKYVDHVKKEAGSIANDISTQYENDKSQNQSQSASKPKN